MPGVLTPCRPPLSHLPNPTIVVFQKGFRALHPLSPVIIPLPLARSNSAATHLHECFMSKAGDGIAKERTNYYGGVCWTMKKRNETPDGGGGTES